MFQVHGYGGTVMETSQNQMLRMVSPQRDMNVSKINTHSMSYASRLRLGILNIQYEVSIETAPWNDPCIDYMTK